MKRLVVAVFVVLASFASAHAEKLPDKSDRVVAMSRVWAKVKFFHPYLTYKDLDWDAAFVAALPKVEAATTIAEYKAAIDGMLATLKDPVTRIAPADPKWAAATKPSEAREWLTVNKDIVVIDLAAFTGGAWDANRIRDNGKRAKEALAKSRGAVIDLRNVEAWMMRAALEAFVDGLPAIKTWPLERYVVHHGFATQDGRTSGGYYSELEMGDARAATKAPASGPSHVVFVLDQKTPVPAQALGLQASGSATLLASGALDEVQSVTTIPVDAGGEINVRLRMGELVTGTPRADVIAKGALRVRAIALAKGAPARAKAQVATKLPEYRPAVDADYATPELPSRPLRMLAAVRIWATLAHFNPYQYLVKEWDAGFRDALTKLESVSDAKAYADVLRELGVRAGDGHIGIRVANAPPRASVDIAVRLVEKQLVVTRAGANMPLVVGDVIETIDGVRLDAAMQARRPYVSGGTDDAREQRLAGSLLQGDDGTTVVLGVRGAKGGRSVSIVRKPTTPPPPAAPAWKLLPKAIGYVDLRALVPGEIEPMLVDLAKTKAIVFDMRGYPNGTAWALAPRLNTRGAKHGAQFLQPLVSLGQEMNPGASTRFFQELDVLDGVTPYRGKVVVLIDDRAISQSEHTCLFLEEAAGATFVGSPTHGSNGDVTYVRLPGGLRMSFTGQEVRHVDGKQLQKVGIVPDNPIRTTLAGIRAGKDEVLDRALAWIATGK